MLLFQWIPTQTHAGSLELTLACHRFSCPQQDLSVFGEPKQLRHSILATVTAYNTVAGQTDDSPCVAAGGWICGRTDVIACPRTLPLHSWVEVEGLGLFECMDRTASKYNGRFDISFDQDVHAALQWGKQSRIITYEGEY